MLPTKYRLSLRKETPRQRRWIHGKTVDVSFSESMDKKTRAALIVGSYTSTKASQRNLLKRRVRHALLSLLPSILDKSVIVRGKRGVARYYDVYEDLKSLLLNN